MKANIISLNTKKSIGAFLTAAIMVLMMPMSASAHCDTMEGPTVADGYKAMENNNVNYVLKWVSPEYEKEITDKFNLSMKVKDLSPEARQLAEQYFFSEVVRIHRAGEGASFDGLKPAGTPVDEKVRAADESIAIGNLSPMDGIIEQEKMPELRERFEEVMSLKDFDVNSSEAGREYIEAYVSFFKFAEGEEDGHHASENHDAEIGHGAEAVHEPAEKHESAAEHDVDAEKNHIAETPSQIKYTVKSGDTLWEIALKYNTTHQEIQKLNHIVNSSLIYPGQSFVVPVK